MPVNDPRFSTTRWAEARTSELADSARAARLEYLKPLIMLAVGFLLGAGWPAMQAMGADGFGAAAAVIGFYGFLIGLSIVIGLPALILTCRLFGCDAGPLGLVAARLAGIFAVVLLVQSLLGIAGIIGLIITLFITGGLFALLFEMDVREGIFCAVVTWLTWVAVSIALFAMTEV